MGSPWTFADFPLPPVLLALAFVLIFGFAAFFIDFIRKTDRYHSSADAGTGAVFEDPNSLKRVACTSLCDPSEKYLSLIIPAFNEEHRLPGAFAEAMNYLQQRAAADKSFTYEVVIVDDGSTDGTQKIAFDYVRKHTIDVVRVILLGKNQGKGEAIRKGMLCARGELLLMLDADGATKVTDLEKLESQIRMARKEPQVSAATPTISDVAIVAFGSRAHLEKQALATRKWYRNLLMKGFHLVVLLTAGPGIRDTQCGFKMFTRAAAQKLFTNLRLKRWCFDVELVYLCKKLDITTVEVSVNWSEIPGSKIFPLDYKTLISYIFVAVLAIIYLEPLHFDTDKQPSVLPFLSALFIRVI